MKSSPDTPYRAPGNVEFQFPAKAGRSIRPLSLILTIFASYAFFGQALFYARLLDQPRILRGDLVYFARYGLLFIGLTLLGFFLICLTYFYTYRRDYFKQALALLIPFALLGATISTFYYEDLKMLWVESFLAISSIFRNFLNHKILSMSPLLSMGMKPL